MKIKSIGSVLVCFMAVILLFSGCSARNSGGNTTNKLNAVSPAASPNEKTSEIAPALSAAPTFSAAPSPAASPAAVSPKPSAEPLVTPSQAAEPAPSPTTASSASPSAAPTQDINAENPSAETNGLSNEMAGWGFVKKKGERPEISTKILELFGIYDTYCISEPAEGEKTLFLTFDEGYENGYTPQILDTLKEYQVPAAFFVTGAYLRSESELVKRMVDEGHIVGNHTNHHPSMPSVTDDETLTNEILDLDRQFYELTGQDMKYLRPPRGEYSERTLELTAKLGYKTVFWSFAYRDWETDQQQGAQHAYDSVTPYLHDGAIILLHAVSADNTAALPQIIEYARANGYVFKSLDEMK